MDEKQLIELVISPENIVTKSNSLIEAEYRMSAMEFKIVQTVFSNIQPSSSEQLTFSFPIRQFMDMLGLKGHSGYTELKKITKKLFKPIEVTVDGETNQVSWFQLVNYNDKSGTITIEVNSFWQKFLYSLETNFTSYKLFNITHLSSSYSPRIYELLKSRINLTDKRRISLLELRAKLGVAEDQYPKYANFKQRVLLPAQRELKDKSDIYFEFIEHKHGRAVSAIEFLIYRNGIKQSMDSVSTNRILLHSQLADHGLTDDVIQTLIENYSENVIKENLTYLEQRMAAKSIANPAAYLKTAIEQNYAASVKKSGRQEKEQWEAGVAERLKAEAAPEEPHLKNPKEFEAMLLEVIEIKRTYRASEEKLHEEIKRHMVNYQERTEKETGNLVSPSSFSDSLIRSICREVLKEI